MLLPSIAASDFRLATRRVHADELRRRLGEPLLGGNRVTLFDNPADAHGAMFRAIAAARDHINLESAALDASGGGAELLQRLVDRCRVGVRVNLLIDSSGAQRTANAALERLCSAGLSLSEYKPMRRWQARLGRALHLPSQRKLMVVDGRIGFIGRAHLGPAAAPESSGWSDPPSAGVAPPILLAGGGAAPTLQDLHLSVEGPAVQRLQRLFVANWQSHASGPMQQARYFPPLPSLGTQRVGVAAGEPGRQPGPYDEALLGAIDTARSSVMWTPAHWLPPPRMLRSLSRAARRGVTVELLLPGSGDFWAPLHAARSHFTQLLDAGIQIHEHHPTRLHARGCIVDGVWASIGSSHTDWRSGVHPAEAKLVVLDESFAGQMERLFRADVARSQRVDPTAWSSRSKWLRCKETLARRCAFLL